MKEKIDSSTQVNDENNQDNIDNEIQDIDNEVNKIKSNINNQKITTIKYNNNIINYNNNEETNINNNDNKRNNKLDKAHSGWKRRFVPDGESDDEFEENPTKKQRLSNKYNNIHNTNGSYNCNTSKYNIVNNSTNNNLTRVFGDYACDNSKVIKESEIDSPSNHINASKQEIDINIFSQKKNNINTSDCDDDGGVVHPLWECLLMDFDEKGESKQCKQENKNENENIKIDGDIDVESVIKKVGKKLLKNHVKLNKKILNHDYQQKGINIVGSSVNFNINYNFRIHDHSTNQSNNNYSDITIDSNNTDCYRNNSIMNDHSINSKMRMDASRKTKHIDGHNLLEHRNGTNDATIKVRVSNSDNVNFGQKSFSNTLKGVNGRIDSDQDCNEDSDDSDDCDETSEQNSDLQDEKVRKPNT